MEDTIAEKLLTIAENEQNVFNAGYEKGLASGGVTINNQDKTITENGVYQADEGYTGLGTVTVEVASTGGGDIDALLDKTITEVKSNAKTIPQYAFYSCKNLTTIDLPNVTDIDDYAFENCYVLTTVNLPSARFIKKNVFKSCKMLKNLDLPSLNSFGSSAANGCTQLATINMPVAQYIYANAFYNCNALTTINLPELFTADIMSFYNCSALTTINTSKLKKIEGSAFANCYSLKTVVLREEQVATLANVNAFNNAYHLTGTVDATYNPNGLKDGYIYVPKDLVESYKTATNWSTYATQFRALEDYTVDGTVNGELDESKI